MESVWIHGRPYDASIHPDGSLIIEGPEEGDAGEDYVNEHLLADQAKRAIFLGSWVRAFGRVVCRNVELGEAAAPSYMNTSGIPAKRRNAPGAEAYHQDGSVTTVELHCPKQARRRLVPTAVGGLHEVQTAMMTHVGEFFDVEQFYNDPLTQLHLQALRGELDWTKIPKPRKKVTFRRVLEQSLRLTVPAQRAFWKRVDVSANASTLEWGLAETHFIDNTKWFHRRAVPAEPQWTGRTGVLLKRLHSL